MVNYTLSKTHTKTQSRGLLPTAVFVSLFLGVFTALGVGPYPESNLPPTEKTDSFAVYFNVGASDFTRSGLETLQRLTQTIDSIGEKGNSTSDSLRKITIIGTASIEGPLQLNESLSFRRADIVSKYLQDKTSVREESFPSISTESRGEDWRSLRKMVETDPAFPHKEEIIGIIDSEISEQDKEQRLRSIENAWNYMAQNVFPKLRKADITLLWQTSSAEEAQPTLDLPLKQGAGKENSIVKATDAEKDSLTYHSDCISVLPTEIQSPFKREVYLKTNLPAWLLFWSNIGAEIDIAPHFSAELSIYYSGLDYFSNRLKFRTFTIMPECRYWPSRHNDGFFTGIHFGLAYYNVALFGENRYQDHDGTTPALGGGLTVGWRMPLHSPRWKIEFSVGAGIYRLDYDEARLS